MYYYCLSHSCMMLVGRLFWLGRVAPERNVRALGSQSAVSTTTSMPTYVMRIAVCTPHSTTVQPLPQLMSLCAHSNVNKSHHECKLCTMLRNYCFQFQFSLELLMENKCMVERMYECMGNGCMIL